MAYPDDKVQPSRLAKIDRLDLIPLLPAAAVGAILDLLQRAPAEKLGARNPTRLVPGPRTLEDLRARTAPLKGTVAQRSRRARLHDHRKEVAVTGTTFQRMIRQRIVIRMATRGPMSRNPVGAGKAAEASLHWNCIGPL
jgi:hypothetical protein